MPEFGLKVVAGPHPRADLLIWDGNTRLAAAEVRGLTGPVRERNLRQAERWAADVNSALTATPEDRKADIELEQYAAGRRREETCSGTRVSRIDDYQYLRATPLDQRTSENFPNPVRRTIERSRVVLSPVWICIACCRKPEQVRAKDQRWQTSSCHWTAYYLHGIGARGFWHRLSKPKRGWE